MHLIIGRRPGPYLEKHFGGSFGDSHNQGRSQRKIQGGQILIGLNRGTKSHLWGEG